MLTARSRTVDATLRRIWPADAHPESVHLPKVRAALEKTLLRTASANRSQVMPLTEALYLTATSALVLHAATCNECTTEDLEWLDWLLRKGSAPQVRMLVRVWGMAV